MPHPPATDDPTAPLLRRAVSGDPAAATALVERFTPLLLAQARYRMGPALRELEPADLVQDVWAIALPQLADLRPADGLWTPAVQKLLATLLLRRTNELLRQAVRRQARHAAAVHDTAVAGAAPPLPTEVTGALQRLLGGGSAFALQQALDTLPEDLRQIALLRGIERLRRGDVARLLGIDEAAVDRRCRAATERLRELLPGAPFPEPEPA